MSLEQTISAETIRNKLRNLKEYMPQQERIIYDLGAYLAVRIEGEDINPFGFNMVTTLVLYDLMKGVSGFPNKPLPSNLIGYPKQMYAVLGISVDQIAEAVLPKEFADEVKNIGKQIREGKV